MTRTEKEEKLFQNLLRATSQLIQGKRFVALLESELAQKLSLPDQHLSLFRDVLEALMQQGHVELAGGKYRKKSARPSVITGTLRAHHRGFAFVQPSDSTFYEEDIFIPKHLTQNAVDGDIVEVEVNKKISEKGPEGRVIAIVTRSRTHIAGIIRLKERSGELIAYCPLLGSEHRVLVLPDEEQPLRVGDRVVMKIIEWGSKTTETVCKVSHYIGHISDPSCDITAAIEEHGLRSDFPHLVVEEAHALGTRVSTQEIRQREDFRDLVTVTIDPDTAKDFDDALSLTKDERGHYHLGVHIADVSHYVQMGSALDEEAKQRCNSTYFPGKCIPMLPSELSDNLCSLKPNVNRLTISVLIEFDALGRLLNYRISKSVIKSHKRFTYREAKAVLDGKRASKYAPQLKLMVELCLLLKRQRYERGSIEFALPDLVVIVDQNGIPTKMDYIEYDITHQLVEEFMLKANELVAQHLSEKGKNLPYRVHDEPAEENLRDFSILASAFGFKLSETPTPMELQKFFDEALDTAYGQYLATSYIRRMRLAQYSPENIGHYGLGLTHYCHFTSPIRRYVDLIVHRILFGGDDNREELENISLQSSEQERISAKAEMNVVTLKKLRLLSGIHSKESFKQYEAVVTKVKPFGIFFEIIDFMLEGFLRLSELEDDYYVYEDANMLLRGRHSGFTYHSGDRITVLLKNVDLILLETQWSLVPQLPERFSRKNEQEHKNGRPKFSKPIPKRASDFEHKGSEPILPTRARSPFPPLRQPFIAGRQLPPATAKEEFREKKKSHKKKEASHKKRRKDAKKSRRKRR